MPVGRPRKVPVRPEPIENSVQTEVIETSIPKPEEQTISLTKDQLQSIISTVETLKDQMDKQKIESEREIEILRDSVNRSRLENADVKHGKVGDQRPRGHLKKVLGKVVLRWKNRDESPIIGQNRVLYKGATPVDEIVNLHAVYLDKKEDGTYEEDIISYLDFARSTEYVYFRVIDVKKIGNEIVWVIEFEDKNLVDKYGNIEIPIKYVNP